MFSIRSAGTPPPSPLRVDVPSRQESLTPRLLPQLPQVVLRVVHEEVPPQSVREECERRLDSVLSPYRPPRSVPRGGEGVEDPPKWVWGVSLSGPGTGPTSRVSRRSTPTTTSRGSRGGGTGASSPSASSVSGKSGPVTRPPVPAFVPADRSERDGVTRTGDRRPRTGEGTETKWVRRTGHRNGWGSGVEVGRTGQRARGGVTTSGVRSGVCGAGGRRRPST